MSINPSTPGSQPPIPPSGSAQGSSTNKPANFMDPSGQWMNFFQKIMPGQEVTTKEVQAFQLGVMRWFSSIIKQEDKSWKETMKKMKDALEGNN